MSDIYVKQGTLVSEVSLVAFIRKQDIVFDADNLRPYKIARAFFDDIAVTQFCQKGNKLVLNSKKKITVNANSAIASTSNTVYQGTTLAAATFTAVVDNYYSGNNTLIIKSMSGNFDEGASIFVQNANGVTAFSANIVSVSDENTSDIFVSGEGLICPNTNVYMEVLGTSGENILYVNENFVNLDVSDNTAIEINNFKIDDLVFQTPGGANRSNAASYVGRVVYSTGSGGSISLQTIKGKLNVNSSSANVSARLFNASNTTTASLLVKNNISYNLSPNNVVTSITAPSKNVAIVLHQHNSGSIATANANTVEGGGQYVYVNSSNTTIANGNLMYITAGTGLGQIRRVVAISGNRITLNSAFTIDPSHTSRYSFGNHIVDENGSLSGIFNVPSEPNFKFKTGERVFSVTDTNVLSDQDFTMKASAKFTASGLLNKTQKIVTTPINRPMPEYNPDNPITPLAPTDRTYTSTTQQQPITGSSTVSVPRVQLADGLSQTFFTPKPASNKVNNGLFVTSVDLFFKSKPSVANASLQLPVTVKIAEVSNGFPTKNYVAAKTVKAKNVKVSSNPSTSNTATVTKFQFDDPVYLQPDSEYAIVVSSESPEYELYIAELGGDVLGADPPRRISEQPYAGSLFRSQNATTWTPYQNQDLMFVVNKAVFASSGSATFNLEVPPRFTQNIDRLMIHSNQLTFPSSKIDFRVKSLFKANGNSEAVGYYVPPHKEFTYGSLLDTSTKLSSTTNTNSRLIQLGNANSVMIVAEFTTSDSDITPIFNSESLSIVTVEHDINNGELSNTVISLTNRGVGYNAYTSSGNVIRTHAGTTESDTPLANSAKAFRQTFLSDSYNVGMYAISINGGNGSGANGFAVANTSGSNTVDYIVMFTGGSGYVENPTISIAKGTATTNVNAEAIISGETGKSGGNIRTKYLTRQIVLEDGFESGDLRVFMDVIRPNGTDIQVYYKVLSAEDPDRFNDKRWVRMLKRVDKKSKSQREVVELEFKPNLEENKLYYYDNGVKYPIGEKFKYFAIKVCMMSEDQAVIPIVRNLRIIATPEG